MAVVPAKRGGTVYLKLEDFTPPWRQAVVLRQTGKKLVLAVRVLAGEITDKTDRSFLFRGWRSKLHPGRGRFGQSKVPMRCHSSCIGGRGRAHPAEKPGAPGFRHFAICDGFRRSGGTPKEQSGCGAKPSKASPGQRLRGVWRQRGGRAGRGHSFAEQSQKDEARKGFWLRKAKGVPKMGDALGTHCWTKKRRPTRRLLDWTGSWRP